jgi:hypothetical protein
MRALVTMIITLLSAGHAYSQVIIQRDTLMNETFEFGSPTAGKWGAQFQSDTTCKKTEWRTKPADSPFHNSRYATYLSSNAKPSCSHFYYSPTWNVKLRSLHDTLFITMLVYRAGALPAGDALVVHLGDINYADLDSFTIGAYYKSAPATDTGWQKVTWAIPATSIKHSGEYRVFFSPKIVGDVDLLLDDVIVELKWQKQTGKLLFDQKVPNTLPSGKKYIIDWHHDSSTAVTYEVKLEYSINKGQLWVPLTVTSAPTNQYIWDVPRIAEDSVQLRITDLFDTTMRAVSNPFDIVWPVELLNPNGRGWLYAGLKVPITWKTGKGVNKLRISFTADDGFHWNDLATNVNADTGQWLWTVPDISTSKARVRITDMEDNLLFDWSDTLFGVYNGLGIENGASQKPSLVCYPNPSDGKFSIKTNFSGPGTLKIADLMGRTVYADALSGGNSEYLIDLRGIRPGTYCILFSFAGGNTRQLIIIK